MRACACLLVLAYHVCSHPVSHVPDFIRGFFQSCGPLGVAIFFVLSGMLLSIPFWSAYFDGGRFPGLPGYAARPGRILPAYYACLIILFAIQAFVLPPLSLSDLIRLRSDVVTDSFTGGLTSPPH